MILSILIPTLPERGQTLISLMGELVRNKTDEVEILVDDRPRPTPTGTKRNSLISRALGQWIVFIDDDDRVAENYIPDILKALEQNPDCVTFRGWMTTNGQRKQNFFIRLGSAYETKNEVHYRFPNHITPIRKDIASQVRFPDTTFGEDYAWSLQIRDRGLLKSEVYIDKDLYFYLFRSKNVV